MWYQERRPILCQSIKCRTRGFMKVYDGGSYNQLKNQLNKNVLYQIGEFVMSNLKRMVSAVVFPNFGVSLEENCLA